jgi:DNA replication ATP-dependent helicase Dna2
MRSVDPDFPVVFLDTDKIRLDLSSRGEGLESLERTLRNRDGGSIVNYVEARIVQLIVEGFLSCGMEAQAVGVICPFRAQLRVMDECASLASWKSKGLEMSTIDRYQGRDKPVVVVSFVRSNEKGRVGRLLQDFRRLNVAITRAKCKLVMVGSFTTLYAGSDALKPVLNRMRNKDNVVSLSPNVFTTNIHSQ